MVTDGADSRIDMHFSWHSNDVYKTWYLNLYEMNGWETSSLLTLVQWPSHDAFLLILFCRKLEPGDSKRRSRDKLL